MTEYSVLPSPAKETPADILQMYKEKPINLEALFTGDNPFGEAAIYAFVKSSSAFSSALWRDPVSPTVKPPYSGGVFCVSEALVSTGGISPSSHCSSSANDRHAASMRL